MRGQAVVEAAFVLPVLLLLLLGMLQSGFGMLTSLQLQHAAQQAAMAGCKDAPGVVGRVYGSHPDAVHCSQTGKLVEVRLTDATLALGPWGSWNISVVGRAEHRGHTE